MSAPLYLSRVRMRISHGEALSAIAPLLLPADKNRRTGNAHNIIWLLFQDVPDAARDFLWREEGDGRYFIFSRRPPMDRNNLFEIDSKPFEPALAQGDELAFVLRANPVMASKGARDQDKLGTRERGKRVDVVMHALYGDYSQGQRKDLSANGELAPLRDRIVAVAGEKWLAAQGQRNGFTLKHGSLEISGYEQVPVERKRGRPAGFSRMDFAGKLAITDPALFLAKLASGFGSAKAFGNGLMLVRRA